MKTGISLLIISPLLLIASFIGAMASCYHLLIITTIVLLILKLAHIANISLFLVFVPAAIAIASLVCAFLIAILKAAYE